MTGLIDTDITIDWLRGRTRAVQFLASFATGDLAISMMTYGEIYEGIYFGRDPKQAERVFREFLRSVGVLPLNRRIMRRFATLSGSLRRQGQLLPDADLLIAATALEYNLPLVTSNVRHFQRIPDMQLLTP